MNRRTLLLTSVASLLLVSCHTVQAPQAIAPLPEPKQVAWQQMETYAFVHFGLNTFNDREWGYGDSDPATFNPKRLDCEQWVRTFVAAGMKGVILTAKHHDGFCLWPTHLTEYCIRNTPYKDGKGDVVGELAAACRKYGIKFAVYLSPWDRHQANYGTPEYVDYFYKQLEELLTNYGEVFEIWFDGANGGDGWYGGAKDRRNIDRKTYYNYPRAYRMIDELQPQAVIFSDGGPGCRWVGNEKGFANATNWSFLRKGAVYPGYNKHLELGSGHPDGNQWTAAECDVSIRPGWFYHASQDNQVKTVGQLTDLYYRSVGRNATLLLNFPVNRDGLIHPTDSANAVNFHKRICSELATDLLAGLRAEASSDRGGKYGVKRLTDNDYDTYWAPQDGVTDVTLTYTLPAGTRINRLMLQEYIPLGQRVKAFTVEYRDGNGTWRPVDPGEETTTIGYKRLLRFPTVTANGLRIHITDARACPCLNTISAFCAPEWTAEDSRTATEKWKTLPFTLIGKELKALQDQNPSTTAISTERQITLDLGKKQTISRLHYLPDQHVPGRGIVTHYRIEAGETTDHLKTVAEGEFQNVRNNPIRQTVTFGPIQARYVRFTALHTADDGKDTGIAELGIE